MTNASLPLTSSIIGSLAGTLDQQSKSSRDNPEAVKKAATEFEALLIGEVLKTSREADGSGWMGTDEEEAGSTLSELSEQQIAQALSTGGGFGLSNMIAKGLQTTKG